MQEIHLRDFELSKADSFVSTPLVWLAELEQGKNKTPFVLVSHNMLDSHDTGLELNSLSVEETGGFLGGIFHLPMVLEVLLLLSSKLQTETNDTD